MSISFIHLNNISRGTSSMAQSLGAMSVGSGDSCSSCGLENAEILFVPCGHRVLCKQCCSKLSKARCPQCGLSVKQMYDKGGGHVVMICVVSVWLQSCVGVGMDCLMK